MDEYALAISCPMIHCLAEPGEKCSQTEHLARTGEKTPSPWVHPNRRMMGLDQVDGVWEKVQTEREFYVERWDREIERHEDQWQRGLKQAVKDRQIAEDRAEVVRTTDCPTCGANRRTQCWNLGERANGRKTHATPHKERIAIFKVKRSRQS